MTEDIRMSFDRVAHTYDRVRPPYPSALFDDLFAMLPPEPAMVEVGPGTGQATRDLLARGATVRAVEIGPSMAEVLRANLPSDRLTVIIGDFEAVGLPLGETDSVFAATAYHWIAADAQTDRPAELLRPGGMMAIVDLIQVASGDDRGFFVAAQPIYERHGQPHAGPPAPRRSDVDPPMRAVLERDRRFGSVELRAYDWNQTYSAAQYRELMLSYSVTQMMSQTARRSLLDEIEDLVRSRFDGFVTRPLVVTLTTAVRI